MNTMQLMKSNVSLSGIYSATKFKLDFKKEHPEYFDPDGILVFCGPQGSGKTLSMVNYAYEIAKFYPECIIVSNVELKNFPNPERIFPYKDVKDLVNYSNGYKGVLFLIDEMHLLFNSLMSKDIDFSVFQEISQQRKQRKHIVGTSQVFSRLAKPFREQFKYAVLCKKLFGVLQYNVVIDGETATEDSDGKIVCDNVKRVFNIHTPEQYLRYDTYAKVKASDLKGVKK